MKQGSVIALGTFDGVHLGHRAIIGRALDEAESRGLTPLIYTFTTHPMAVFGRRPPLLMGDAERIDALSQFCLTETDDFTPEFAGTEPEDFIKALVSRFDMKAAVAGFNYTFGSRGRGDTELLKKLGAKLGFDVIIVPPVMHEEEPVSSTRIREALERGDVGSARAMLGAPYTLTGTVERNRGIGKSVLGFPTANLEGFEGRVIPEEGVYAAFAQVRGMKLAAVTNIGRNPTFGGERLTVESHLMGFDGDIYGEPISVAFIERLRGDMDFGSADALRARIALDAQKAREILEKAEK